MPSLNCPSCNKSSNLQDLAWSGAYFGCYHCGKAGSNASWIAKNPSQKGTFFFLDEATEQKTGWLRKQIESSVFGAGNLQSDRMRNAMPLNLDANDGTAARVKIHIVRDGVDLIGRYYSPPSGQGRKTILLLSGSGAAAVEYCRPIVEGYLKLGYSVLLVDYRGFGASSGSPTSKGTYKDSEAMWAYLTWPEVAFGRALKPNDIVVHGYSLGSGPAVHLCREHMDPSPAGLVLHCPMASAGANASLAFGGGVLGGAVGRLTNCYAAFNNEKKVGALKLPTMVITGSTDRMKAQGVKLKGLMSQAVAHEYTGGHMDQGKIFSGGDLANFLAKL